MTDKFSILIGFLAGLLGAAVFWGIQSFTQKQPPTLATLNVRVLKDEEIARVAKSTLSPQQAAEQVRQYGARLSKNIEVLAKKHNLIILPEQAVIAGGADITDAVRGNGDLK